LAAPMGTPPEVIAKLNAAAVQGTKSPEFVKRMTELGYNILGTSAAEMASMNQTEINRWGPIVRASGAKVD
jgi:tripartite-type tricarboxylate transporter receptor subunit TctC